MNAEVRPNRLRRLDPEDAIARRAAGETDPQIAAAYGLTASTVHHAIRYHTDAAFRERHVAAASKRGGRRRTR